MQDFTKMINKYQILQSLFYLLAGIFLIAKPLTFFKGSLYLISGYFIVIGLIGFIKKAEGSPSPFASSSMILIGLLLLVFVTPLLKLANIVFGILIALHGLRKVMAGKRLRQEIVNASPSVMIYGGILVVLGLIILLNPFKSILFLLRIVGAILVSMGILDLIGSYVFKI